MLNKVLALSRVLKKLAVSFNHLQIPWVCRQRLVFCFSTQAGCQVAGCGCCLYLAFSGSFFFILNGRVILAEMDSPKICAAASLEICCCVGAALFPVDLMSGAGSFLLTFLTVNNSFSVK